MENKWLCLLKRAGDEAPEPMRFCALFDEKNSALTHARENPGHVIFRVLRENP